MKKLIMMFMLMFVVSCAGIGTQEPPKLTQQQMAHDVKIKEVRDVWEKQEEDLRTQIVIQTKSFASVDLSDIAISKDGLVAILTVKVYLSDGFNPNIEMKYKGNMYFTFSKTEETWVQSCVIAYIVVEDKLKMGR